jgi:hypothetical protein
VTQLRRAAFTLGLAWARLRTRRLRGALVVLGIAAAAAVLAAVLGGSLVAQDRSVHRAVGAIPAADRAVRATWLGVPTHASERWPSLDADVRSALEHLPGGRPTPVLVYRETSIDEKLVDLAAVDGLSRWLTVVSGRLPHRCVPSRCEVLQLGGAGGIPSTPGLRLAVVGRAKLASAVPFGGFLSESSSGSIFGAAERYHQAAAPPFLVADGVAGLARAPELADVYRSYAWVAAVRPAAVHPWSVSDFADSVTRTRSALRDRSALFDLTAPVDELAAAERASRVGARRLLLIGGEAAALLLAFAVLAAASMRTDVDAAWRRLTWFGARRWQLVAVSGAEIGALALVGAALGWLVGSAAAGILADRLGSPAGAVLAHSAGSPRGLGLAVAVAVAATLTVLLALRVRPVQLGRLSVTILDVAALGALVALLVAIARGATDAESLAADGGTGAVLLLLPALVSFVAAVAAARLLAPALRLAERLGRGRAVPLRLAALSLARRPGQAAIAVAFLVVSLGLALFAGTYRATLARGQSDQADYAVPVDAVLSEDLTKLVPVSDVAAPAAPGIRTDRVLRLSGDVSRLSSGSFTLLGVRAGTLPELRWRKDYSDVSPGELGRRLAPRAPTRFRGARLPTGLRELRLPVVQSGDDVSVSATVRDAGGRFVTFALGRAHGRRELARPIPAAARGGLLVGLTLGLVDTGLHGVPNGGANVAPVARGTLALGQPRGAHVDYARWLGTNGVTGSGPTLRYVVTSQAAARFRARQATDGAPIPVAASPALAAAAGPGGILPLSVTGEPLRARVVAVVDRFPTVAGNVVVADGDTVTTALNAEVPGSALPNELWAGGDPATLRRELARPPYDALSLESRSDILASLRSEPIARGSLVALAAAALAALALALAGLALGLLSDLRDEQGELFDLEAQGAEPETLRRHLRLRTLALAGFGLVGGLITGAALSLLVVSLVRLTASATAAEPPLVLATPWTFLALAVATYAAAATLLAVGLTAGAFRSARVARPAGATV